MRLFAALVLLMVGASACTGSSVNVAPARQQIARTPTVAVFTIIVPSRTASRTQYISPSSASVKITVDGSSTVADLTTQSPNCTSVNIGLQCSLQIPAQPGQAVFSVSVYDQPGATGNLLSTGSGSLTVVSGQSNPISIILSGVSTSVTLSLLQSIAPVGTPASIRVLVQAYDADGNLILGAGDYSTPIVLTDADPSGQTSLSKTTLNSPVDANVVTLQYNGGGSLQSASISASAGSGVPIASTAFSPFKGQYYGIPTANSSPGPIVSGNDGNLWFVEDNAFNVGRVSPQGVISEIPVGVQSAGVAIAPGPDGNMWLTTVSLTSSGYSYGLEQIQPGGATNQYALPLLGAAITSGPDDALWALLADPTTFPPTYSLGRINVDGTSTVLAPLAPQAFLASVIVAGADGRLYTGGIAGLLGGGIIDQVTPGGSVNSFSVPNTIQVTSLTAGPDGNIWFVGAATVVVSGSLPFTYVGFVTPSGVFSTYLIPSGGKPLAISVGPDGALWFPEDNGNLGRVTTGGIVSELAFGPANPTISGITTGPDRNLWLVQQQPAQVFVFRTH